MHHMDGNIARPCQLHGFALGLVGNFVGEHDHPVRIADLVHEIPFIAANALKTVAAFLAAAIYSGFSLSMPPIKVTHIAFLLAMAFPLTPVAKRTVCIRFT